MEFDEDLQPWLRGMSPEQRAQLAVDLTYAICRPSFGSLTKRELEQTLFKLLYEYRRETWTSLSEIAEDLAITRSKARSLLQEYRNRETGRLPRGKRLELLRTEVRSWPRQNVEQDEQRLRVVVDDPFIRDLLKNFAYSRRILVDQSFSSEIVVFGWDSYGKLLGSIYEATGNRVPEEDLTVLFADLRRQIEKAAAVDRLADAELEQQLKKLDEQIEKIVRTPEKRRREKLAALGKEWGPTGVGVALGFL
jgi:hypothetical protein